MPVLPAEPDLFPDHLFAEPPDAEIARRQWCVLHTKPRQEKSLARQLLETKVPFYLPCVPRRWTLRGRAMTSHLPLFPSYLFLLGDRDERLSAFSTRRV